MFPSSILLYARVFPFIKLSSNVRTVQSQKLAESLRERSQSVSMNIREEYKSARDLSRTFAVKVDNRNNFAKSARKNSFPHELTVTVNMERLYINFGRLLDETTFF